MKTFEVGSFGNIEILGDSEKVYLPSHYAKKFIECLVGQPLAGTRFLDIGCGTGVIGIAAAKMGAEVVCSDVNAEAVESTLENAKRNAVQLDAIVSHGFDELTKLEAFDLIACNAPSNPNFVNNVVTPVNNGEDGRAFLDAVLTNAPTFLKRRGRLLSCSGSEQDWTKTSRILSENWADYKIIADMDEDFSSLSQFSEDVLRTWVDRGLCWESKGKVFHNVKYFFAYK